VQNPPSLAQRLAEQVRREVLPRISPGAPLPPLRRLAAELGVSITTLRAAQTLLAREGLLQLRHGSGVYRSDASPAPWIGIVSELDLCAPRTSAYFTLVVSRLRHLLSKRGFQAELYVGLSQPGEHREQPSCGRLLADLRAGRLSGLVFVDAPETYAWRQFIDALQVPAVGALTPCIVGPEPALFVEAGVEELQRQGCRRLAMLTWDHRMAAPFFEALATRALRTCRGWVRSDLHPQHAGAGWEELREIWSAAGEKPDGLLVGDDLLMEDAAKAICELRIRVPADLRIVTHCNRGSAIRLPLAATRIVYDPEAYARRFVDLLMDLLAGRTPAAGGGDIPFAVEHVEAHEVVAPT
jgi:DNA-binding LacI/PurR family transcriptional regulator